MTEASLNQSAVERLAAAGMLVVFWAAFACLAVGLGLWVGSPENHWAARLLAAGLLGLMLLPMLRLVAAMAAAQRHRDWLTVAAGLAVLAILLALTLRDAARLD